jgi:hypothetical protein
MGAEYQSRRPSPFGTTTHQTDIMMRRILGLLALLLAVSAPLQAQAFAYPAFQPTRVAEREYNFAIADLDGNGTGLVFQWREGLGNPKLQFTLDAGFVDFDGPVDGLLMLGGALNYQLARSTADMPFDLVFTGGLGFSTSDNLSVIRIPIGVAAGHRFALDGNFAITPFVHPRLSVDRVSIDTPAGDVSDTETNIDFDIGANFEINPRMALRLAALLGDSDAIGLSFAWTPRGLRNR